jgi:hypothetical protein
VSPAGQPDWVGYIALHKKVKGLFAVQYGSTIWGLTVSQSASHMVFACRPEGRPSAVWLENQKQEEAKKVGKTSENRPF